jgi:hypothetical protein
VDRALREHRRGARADLELDEPRPVLEEDTGAERRVERVVYLGCARMGVRRVHAAGTKEPEWLERRCLVMMIIIINSMLERGGRTHRDAMANDSWKVPGRCGDGVAGGAGGGTDGRVGIVKVEDQLLVGEELQAIDLGRRVAELSDKPRDGGSGATLLGKGKGGKKDGGGDEGKHRFVSDGKERK